MFFFYSSDQFCATELSRNMSIYDIKFLARNGTERSMAEFKGKVLIIVNTATGCGFTPQYKGLEDLYLKYHDQGLEVLDFPCNQFGHQAPGSDEEIHEFCTAKYKTTFDQFKKVEVNGEKEAPLFTFLKAKKGFSDAELYPEPMKKMLREKQANWEETPDIKWNFTKFLVDRNGEVVKRIEPLVAPEAFAAEVEALLKQ